jgi:hypothetical protein
MVRAETVQKVRRLAGKVDRERPLLFHLVAILFGLVLGTLLIWLERF